jgi:hypothetical protein
LLPKAAVRVQAWVRSCGICGGQSGTGVGLLRVFRFPLPIFIPPIAPQSPSSIILGWYSRPVVAAVLSGLSLTPLRIIQKTRDKCTQTSCLEWDSNTRPRCLRGRTRFMLRPRARCDRQLLYYEGTNVFTGGPDTLGVQCGLKGNICYLE